MSGLKDMIECEQLGLEGATRLKKKKISKKELFLLILSRVRNSFYVYYTRVSQPVNLCSTLSTYGHGEFL